MIIHYITNNEGETMFYSRTILWTMIILFMILVNTLTSSSLSIHNAVGNIKVEDRGKYLVIYTGNSFTIPIYRNILLIDKSGSIGSIDYNIKVRLVLKGEPLNIQSVIRSNSVYIYANPVVVKPYLEATIKIDKYVARIPIEGTPFSIPGSSLVMKREFLEADLQIASVSIETSIYSISHLEIVTIDGKRYNVINNPLPINMARKANKLNIVVNIDVELEAKAKIANIIPVNLYKTNITIPLTIPLKGKPELIKYITITKPTKTNTVTKYITLTPTQENTNHTYIVVTLILLIITLISIILFTRKQKH